jgi:hypothetical protein
MADLPEAARPGFAPGFCLTGGLPIAKPTRTARGKRRDAKPPPGDVRDADASGAGLVLRRTLIDCNHLPKSSGGMVSSAASTLHICLPLSSSR